MASFFNTTKGIFAHEMDHWPVYVTGMSVFLHCEYIFKGTCTSSLFLFQYTTMVTNERMFFSDQKYRRVLKYACYSLIGLAFMRCHPDFFNGKFCWQS